MKKKRIEKMEEIDFFKEDKGLDLEDITQLTLEDIKKKYPITAEEERLLQKIKTKTQYETILAYGEMVQKANPDAVATIDADVDQLEDERLWGETMEEGFEIAILGLYPGLKCHDKGDLMLIQFLEEFHDVDIGDPDYLPLRDKAYQYAFSLALKVAENPNFLMRLYHVNDKKDGEEDLLDLDKNI